jgi:hypothetical protein
MFSFDDIRIASPCKSDWDQMYGDDRRRFCAECKLNVYNLSGMTRDEAERLVMNSEGRLCVRFFRRKDGTILTQDCPVGWKAVKKRATRVAVAFSSILAGFLAGVFSLRAVDATISAIPIGDVEQPVAQCHEQRGRVCYGDIEDSIPTVGEVDDYTEWKGEAVNGQVVIPTRYSVGRLERIQRLQDVKVKAWVK